MFLRSRPCVALYILIADSQADSQADSPLLSRRYLREIRTVPIKNKVKPIKSSTSASSPDPCHFVRETRRKQKNEGKVETSGVRWSVLPAGNRSARLARSLGQRQTAIFSGGSAVSPCTLRSNTREGSRDRKNRSEYAEASE